MRLLAVGLLLLSGCGLLLDVDPAESDGGTRPDTGDVDGGRDAGFTDTLEQDAADVGVDSTVPFDGGPPIDGGSCMSVGDCDLRNPGCNAICVENFCEVVDDDEDGVCDPLDMCTGGEVEYEREPMCTTRTRQVCVGEDWVPYDFREVESCSDTDGDCDGMIDDGLDVPSCGVGECATTRACGESCVGEMGVSEVCSAPGEIGVDEDCDGHVDEGCAQSGCTPIYPADASGEPHTITAPGDYCLVLGSCTATNVGFILAGGGPLSDVRIHGDMHTLSGSSPLQQCPREAVPRSQVRLTSSLVIGGVVQATNVRFSTVNAITSGAVRVEGGTFYGHHIGIDGGRGPALTVAAGATAHLSAAAVTSGASDHTIDSQGHLVIESSCGGRFNERGRCGELETGASVEGVTKSTGGGSVIRLSGPAASLQMTAARVWGQGSTALWGQGTSFINVFDSVLVASQPAALRSGSTRDAVALEGCSSGIIRDSYIVNQGNDIDESSQRIAVRARACPMRFAAPNLTTGDRFHIIAGTGVNLNATGVQCEDGCRFEGMRIAGLGPASDPPIPANGIGIECIGGCDVVNSAAVGNAASSRVASATGLAIGAGTVLRSRLLGGDAAVATGLLSSGGGSRVHLQDSLAIGFDGQEDTTLSSFLGRGVLLQATSNLSALHSTIAARTWLRSPSPLGQCRGLEAEAGSQVRMVSSLLWAPCVDGYSVHGQLENVRFMEHVGVATASRSFVGGSILNIDLPFEFLFAPIGVEFEPDYSDGALPNGPDNMVTTLDVNGEARSAPSPIGAYAD